MLGWMQAAGYGLGSAPLPLDGDALIGALMAGLTNDSESGHHPPLDHLALATYMDWYASLPIEGREAMERVWGQPSADSNLHGGT